jgi:hypothetical protein
LAIEEMTPEVFAPALEDVRATSRQHSCPGDPSEPLRAPGHPRLAEGLVSVLLRKPMYIPGRLARSSRSSGVRASCESPD